MGDGNVLALAGSAFLLLDVSNYGIKEWLQLIAAAVGIVVSIIGAWKAWRFSKWQMVNRLFEYLNTDEKHIIGSRRRVLEHLRNGKGATLKSGVELHDGIEKAIKLLHAGRAVEAEESLAGFALMLSGSAEVGRRHTAVASQQAATVLLFMGLIAKQLKDPPRARKAFEEALDHWPEDAEAFRSLGELELRSRNFQQAHQHFDKAIELASRDRQLEVEIWMLKAEAFQSAGDARGLATALLECAKAFAEIEDHRSAGEAYSRAGDAQVSLRHTRRARRTYRSAFDCYERAGNLDRMREMRERLADLKVKDLPAIPTPSRTPIPWPGIRLALELSILAVAAGLFYLSLR